MRILYRIFNGGILFVICMFFFVNGYSQVLISDNNGANKDTSAILDVQSTNKGILIPEVTSAQMSNIANPKKGLMIYNIDDSIFYYFDSNQWVKIGKAAKVWLNNQNYLYTSDDSVGIGKSTPYSSLTVNGRISQTGLGKSVFLGEDAGINNDTSSETHNTGIGYRSLYNNTTGKYNVAAGALSIRYNVTGNYNTAIGYNSLFLSTLTNSNVAIGYNSQLSAFYSSAAHNTSMGSSTLSSNTSGERNTAIGNNALKSNTGDFNTAFGFNSLKENTNGIYNTAMGYTALMNNTSGNSNTSAGSEALANNDDGSYNSAIGDWAMKSNTSGSYNVAMGNEALMNIQTGDYNIAIGNKAGHSLISGNRNVFIGNYAGYYETGSNKLYIDNSSTSKPLIGGDFNEKYIYLNGKTGIGTQYPYESLEVASLNTDGSHSGRMIISDGKGNNRKVLLFVSPNHDDTDTNARIEAFNYGNWTGCLLEINRVGKGNAIFGGDVDVNATIKIASSNSSPSAGTIRWYDSYDKKDFEGYTGGKWLSLTRPNGWIDMPYNNENTSVTASDGDDYDGFGYSVAISGDYVIVGAPWNDINGNGNQGSAYIYYKDGNHWVEQAVLKDNNGTNGERFGFGVSICGNYASVSNHVFGSDAPATFVYQRSGTNWNEQAHLTPSNCTAGFGESISMDSNYLVVGDPQQTVNGNAGQGKVYVFHRSGTSWSEQAQLISSDGAENDHFGCSVSISNGYIAVVGGEKIYVFKLDGNNWYQQAIVSPNNGYVNKVSLYNDYFIEGGNSSSVIFHRSGNNWTQQTQLTDAYSCDDVSLYGNYAVVGMENRNVAGNEIGKVNVYYKTGVTWSKQASIIASDGAEGDHFGASVSINGNNIVVSAYYKNINGNKQQGKVYFYYK